MTVQVTIERGEDGYFVARCPSLKSCWSQGRTKDEALHNIREAIELFLEPDPGEVALTESREVVALTL
jgi:predicted RNase H-like HicB family nuclease